MVSRGPDITEWVFLIHGGFLNTLTLIHVDIESRRRKSLSSNRTLSLKKKQPKNMDTILVSKKTNQKPWIQHKVPSAFAGC